MDSPHFIAPRERLAALADDARLVEHDAHSPSPHLARLGIAAQDDDGAVCATVRIGGEQVEAVAQDARFLRGSVGERHGDKIAAAIARARAARCPLLLLAASGGVRLHEANAAEIALARALRALVDARAGGIVTLAIGVADVFGGMSVLAAACNHLALAPHARFGLSGPRVIELARGRDELDASDAAAVDALFGAPARIAAGIADGVAGDAQAMRRWIIGHRDRAPSFADDLHAAQSRLQEAAAARADPAAIRVDSASVRDDSASARAESARARADSVHARADSASPHADSATARADTATLVEVAGTRATLNAFRREVDAQALVAVDAQLLALPESVRCLRIVEDSRGHETSVRAERAGLSRYLAQHALVLGLLRDRGVRIVGVVDGIGHSAAFFANALQADALFALPGGRIVAMEPRALAGVTGMDALALARAIDDDPLLGQPVRHFAALGALQIVECLDDAR